MKHRLTTFLLILTLMLPPPAAAVDDMFGLMFRMMLTAMNVMSEMVDDNDWGGGWPGDGWNSPWNMAWPAGMGMGMWPATGMGGWPGSGFGMSPWSSLPWGAGSSAWSGMPWGSGWPGNATATPYPVSTATTASLLDGKWYGTTGDILEIRGNRFRLRSGQYSVKGVLSVQQNIVRMYTPKTNVETVYSFLRNQTGLILQEASGNLLVFEQNPVVTGFRNMSYIF